MEKVEKKVEKLIQQFSEHIEEYNNKSYDESNTRTDFIDKFFEYLGWDVRNEKGYSENYREVVREDKIEIKGKYKAPDYSFRIGGIRKFFVEAKKPSINIKTDINGAYQLRRYAYTLKLPLSILTNFKEFSVYDTRIKPKSSDKASIARVFYCKYDNYLKHWDFIKNTFSKQAILKGSFDTYISNNKKKRGTSEIDKEFLKQIDNWRTKLARDIARKNKDLSIYELNFAVQKIIDRIIFLRIAEDRGMEEYGSLSKFIKKDNKKYHIYKELLKYFKQADEKYNSGLFDFQKDTITPKLTIDYKVFYNIIKNLYYPDCPYEFSVLSVEILGDIYEQFLGKTIRLTQSHQAKVEYKPEVKKAGGVYYTPQYIVHYIVQNTLGKKIKNKSPKQIKDLTVLDLTCGSGSFLIAAYDYLLKYYFNYYTKPKNLKLYIKKKLINEISENNYKLSINAKRDILIKHIYGIDIDAQAVEVSKLSLLLKLMEDEHLETMQHLFSKRDLKLLPDLSDNIKCGNSLIASNFFEGQQTVLFDNDLIKRINAFDWDKEFSEIFKKGGFDIIIGNPPYIQIQKLKGKYEQTLLEKQKYESYDSMGDIYCLFYEKGVQVLKKKGILGYITSNKWMRAGYGEKLREFFSKKTNPLILIDFGGYKVFENATVDTNILILKKENNKNKTLSCTIESDFSKRMNIEEYFEKNKISIPFNNSKAWIIIDEKERRIKEKIEKYGTPLKDWDIKIYRGVLTGYNEAFIIDGKKKEELIAKDPKSAEIIKPILRGRDIKRYKANFADKWLINTHNGYINSKGEKIPLIDINDYPAIKEHLDQYWIKLKKRDDKGKTPYNLRNCAYLEEFEKEKIVYQEITRSSSFSYDFKNNFFVLNTAYIITGRNIKYLLSLLNSKLIEYFFRNFISVSLGNNGIRWLYQYIENLPIPQIPKSEQKPFEELVDFILQKKQKGKDTTLEEKQIDKMVYKLYHLTDEEIRIVEGE